jgi:hypothetical protein
MKQVSIGPAGTNDCCRAAEREGHVSQFAAFKFMKSNYMSMDIRIPTIGMMILTLVDFK